MKKKQPQRLVIWATKGMFKSARKLATALKPDTPRQVLIIRSDSLRFKPRATDVVINWGNSNPPNWVAKGEPKLPELINGVNAITISVNKLKTFRALQGHVHIPEWTTDPKDITGKPDDIWLARTKLNGFGGDGIQLFAVKEAVPAAPLYVQYKKKKDEYRVHVFNEKIIDITQKRKRAGFEDVNTKIRNYKNGWVYCREDIDVPDDVKEQAVKAVRHLGLDFGAVDVVFNAKEQQAYVLEVNSAPGLEGSTIEAYKQAILTTIQD